MKKKYIIATALGILSFTTNESLSNELHHIEKTQEQNKINIIQHENINKKYEQKNISYFDKLTPAQARFIEKNIIDYFSKTHWGDYDYSNANFRNIEKILRKKAHLEIQCLLNKELNIDLKKINVLYHNFFTNNALYLQLKNCKMIKNMAEEFTDSSNYELIKNMNNEEKKLIVKKDKLQKLCSFYENPLKILHEKSLPTNKQTQGSQKCMEL